MLFCLIWSLSVRRIFPIFGNKDRLIKIERQRYIQKRQERRRNKDRATKTAATAIAYTHKALEKKSATKVRSLSGRDSSIYGIRLGDDMPVPRHEKKRFSPRKENRIKWDHLSQRAMSAGKPG